MPRDSKIHSDKWGGAGRGGGRKNKWYGKTVSMRIPEIWAAGIKHCMEHNITPNFDNAHKQVDKVSKSRDEAVKYAPELITKALNMYDNGLSAAHVWTELNKLDFTPLPNRSNMKRTLENWKKRTIK